MFARQRSALRLAERPRFHQLDPAPESGSLTLPMDERNPGAAPSACRAGSPSPQLVYKPPRAGRKAVTDMALPPPLPTGLPTAHPACLRRGWGIPRGLGIVARLTTLATTSPRLRAGFVRQGYLLCFTSARRRACCCCDRLRIMAKSPTAESIAEGLSVPERVMLFCVGSGTDWQRAGHHRRDRATDDDPRLDRAASCRQLRALRSGPRGP
jgi:hypothetical protein